MSKYLVRTALCLMATGLFSVAVAQQGGTDANAGQMGSGAPSQSGQMGSSGQSTPSGQMGTNKMGSKSSSSHSGLSASDQKFVKEAAEGGMAEVELGQLAVQKASSDDVKKFGQRMVDDHSKANDKLKEVASNKGVTLPTEPNAKQKATKDRLSKLSGEQFDKAYMKDMLKDHKQDVAAFQHESTTGKDSDIKNFATETLPTLQDHLKDAEAITPKVTQAKSSMAPSAGMQH